MESTLQRPHLVAKVRGLKLSLRNTHKHTLWLPVLGLLLFNYFPPSGTQTTLSEGTCRVQEPLLEAWSTVLTAELGVQLVSQSDYNQLL